MQLVYCYIDEYLNIEGLDINFGSPHYFSTKKDGDNFQIFRQANNQYIPNFYSSKRFRVLNVTALVGENGTGKTNILNFIRNAFGKRYDYISGVLIYMNESGQLFMQNLTNKDIIVNFNVSSTFKKENRSLIYYNPIYDFQEPVLLASSYDIDVSSNTLINDDYYEDQFTTKNLKQVDLHVFKNITRQIDFITGLKFARNFVNPINVPERPSVVLIEPDLPHDQKGLDNVSYDFRPFYEIGVNLWRNERHAIHAAKDEHQRTSKRIRSHVFNRQYAILDSLFYIWKYIFRTQEDTNATLEEGHVKFTDDDIPDLQALSFEKYVEEFLRNQNIFQAKPILDFYKLLKLNIEKSTDIDVDQNGYISFDLELLAAGDLIRQFIKFTNSLSLLLIGERQAKSLLQFDWRNISSGEKAYLDLFARLYYAKRQIEKIQTEKKIKSWDTIYILIDEGETGFHPHWQKEYVKTLVDALPHIINFNRSQNHPNLQLIFTTHSPISLSDVPHYSTVYLKKAGIGKLVLVDKKEAPKYSFGANINEIMYDAFFLKDGFIGKFAKKIIDEIFEWSKPNSTTVLDPVYVRKTIDIVDDPILRIKLEEVYAQKLGVNAEASVLRAKMEQIERRLKQIEKRDDQD
ncbi:MAG TPA: AAA family ATPase [Mucilaginibacter sp.]